MVSLNTSLSQLLQRSESFSLLLSIHRKCGNSNDESCLLRWFLRCILATLVAPLHTTSSLRCCLSSIENIDVIIIDYSHPFSECWIWKLVDRDKHHGILWRRSRLITCEFRHMPSINGWFPGNISKQLWFHTMTKLFVLIYIGWWIWLCEVVKHSRHWCGWDRSHWGGKAALIWLWHYFYINLVIH